MLTATNLTKEYQSGNGRLAVLKQVSFSVPQGAFVAIVGPSGSGKTTLLGLLAGLDTPSAGAVSLDGVDITRMTEDQRALLRGQKVGFIFQSFQLIPTLTALENVQVPLELRGDLGAGDRARELLVVERPEILHRAAAPPDDDDVDFGDAHYGRERADQIRGGAFALHLRRADDDTRVRMALGEDADDVAHCGAVERRDDANATGQHRQRAFAGRLEQAFALEFPFQLLERDLERAGAGRLEGVGDQLIVALLLIDAEPSARDHAHAIFRLELQSLYRRAEHHAAQLCAVIFEAEVEMARTPLLAVGQLAFDEHVAEVRLDLLFESRRQFAHRQWRAWGGRLGGSRPACRRAVVEIVERQDVPVVVHPTTGWLPSR